MRLNHKGEKMKSKIIKSIIWVLVGVLAIGGTYGAVLAYHAPLAPTLSNAPMKRAVSSDTKTCNESGTRTILWIGDDVQSGVWPNGADLIRIVKIDYTNQKIVVMALPRDLSVNSVESESNQRLGLIYFNGKHSVQGTVKDVVAKGADDLAQVITEKFNVQFDNYLVMDMSIAGTWIDTVGGVEVNLPAAVSGDNGVVYPAGKQVLTGSQAMQLVRIFNDNNTEADRFSRQELVMKSFLDKVISLNMITKIPDLLNQAGSNIITDLSPDQIVNLGCMSQKVQSSQISFYDVLGSNFYTVGTDGELVANTDAIASFVAEKLK